MNLADVQGSDAWLAARAGHVTASRFADVMAKIKVGEAKTRRDYRWQLVAERLTGLPTETYFNKAMEWGKQHEAGARLAYESAKGEIVEEVGFIVHPAVAWCGASPDGLLVGQDGGVEIKCPYNSVVQAETVEGEAMPVEHRPQVQGAMWVTGRAWWDFISYDPRMPGKLKLYVERIRRDDIYIAKLAAEVGAFLAETEKLHQSLLRKAA